MDTKAALSEFLASRRAKITPEQAGLSAYARNRRVTGLRREEVAALTGISVEYYTRLERGNVGGVSEDVLEAIARALQLDEAERTHLFDLVRASNPIRRQRRRPAQLRVRPTVQRILDGLDELPAYIRNGRRRRRAGGLRTRRPGTFGVHMADALLAAVPNLGLNGSRRCGPCSSHCPGCRRLGVLAVRLFDARLRRGWCGAGGRS